MTTPQQLQAVRVLVDNLLEKSYTKEEAVSLIEGLVSIRAKRAVQGDYSLIGYRDAMGSLHIRPLTSLDIGMVREIGGEFVYTSSTYIKPNI